MYAYIFKSSWGTLDVSPLYLTLDELKYAAAEGAIEDGSFHQKFVGVVSVDGEARSYTKEVADYIDEVETAYQWNKNAETDAANIDEYLAYYENRDVPSDHEEHGISGRSM